MNIGFIILRHVNNSETNKYWKYCYDSIRKYYPENSIVIIDDNSKKEFVTNYELYKTTIIESKYPKRGELLPYYYYVYNKFFEIAVIIHDSVFINQYLDFNVEKYKIFWDFKHNWDDIEDETKMIKALNDENNELLNYYQDKSLWKGCFGGMVIIKHDFLNKINNKYKLHKLLDLIKIRFNRCSFERVIACILQKEEKTDALFGDIHDYIPWGTLYDDISKYSNLPIIKVWSFRTGL